MAPKVQISSIKTDVFNRIINQLTAEGWQRKNVYNGMDAWIDYGRLDLVKDGAKKLFFEWDNWDEGLVQGPEDLLDRLCENYGLEAPRVAED